ncbi:MAG TPA: hypothetical protein VGP82_10440, partial [Ktedonobacterales bacterium]|nr:hypothetical protein [Ktedonobacterales bacterium]
MANSDRDEERSGFDNYEPRRRDPNSGTEQVSSGQISGRQAIGAGQDTGYSRADTDTELGTQEGQLSGESRAGVGPLGGQPGRGDTADAHAWRQQTGMSGPSGRRDDEEKLGVNSPNDTSEQRDGPGVSGSATTPDTQSAPDNAFKVSYYGRSGRQGLGGANPTSGPHRDERTAGPPAASDASDVPAGTLGTPGLDDQPETSSKDATGYYGDIGDLGNSVRRRSSSQSASEGGRSNDDLGLPVDAAGHLL